MTHVWYHRRWPRDEWGGARQPDLRKGQPCRVLAIGRNGNTLVEFADGARIVGVRYCVRAATEPPRNASVTEPPDE